MHFVAKFYQTLQRLRCVDGMLRHTLDNALWLEASSAASGAPAGSLLTKSSRCCTCSSVSSSRGVHSEQAGEFDIDTQKAIYVNFKA